MGETNSAPTTTYVTGAFQAETLSNKGSGDPVVNGLRVVLHGED